MAAYERAPAATAEAATSSTAMNGWRIPRRRRGSGSKRNRSTSDNPATPSRTGDLIRQTVADWRHIEAPAVQGDLGRSPRSTGASLRL